jgi:uncharacterized protein YxjI
MKKTILFSLLSSFFAANASAAILNVEGEIQINGRTVLEEVNLRDYRSTKDDVKYTAEACINTMSSERDCGAFTKTITSTSKDNYEYEVEEVKDHHGELLFKSVSTRDGKQYSEEVERYLTRYDTDYSAQHWVDINGDDVMINGLPAQPGMYYQDCSSDGSCEDKYWHPEDGDVMSAPLITKVIEVYKDRSTWTESVISGSDDRLIIGMPSISVTQLTDHQSSGESWQIVDGKSGDIMEFDHKNDEQLNINNRTVLAKIPTFGKYSDCIIFDNDEIRCRGVGSIKGPLDLLQGQQQIQWTISE